MRADFPVGVLGLGVLGQRVAQALLQFDFPVNGWSRTPRSAGVSGHYGGQIDKQNSDQVGPVNYLRTFAGREQLDAFLQASKVVVCLLPLTPDTLGILCHATLSRLQPGGVVINVARGAHLVDADLLALLDSGQLDAATLDVFRAEPLPGDHAFWKHPKITLTPHTSARTLTHESITQIVGKIAALERGETVVGVVDRARGY